MPLTWGTEYALEEADLQELQPRAGNQYTLFTFDLIVLWHLDVLPKT